MYVRKLIALFACLLALAAPASAAIDTNTHTWEYLQHLGGDRAVFFTSCSYPKSKDRWLVIVPVGEKSGFIAAFDNGWEGNWGTAIVDKASKFDVVVWFGEHAHRVAAYNANYLFKLPFTLAKPQDFHLIFDSNPAFVCPKIPEYVLSGDGAPVTDAGVRIPVKEGEQLSSGRAKLLKQGWLPVETFAPGTKQPFSHSEGAAGALYEAGIKEVEFCSEDYYCTLDYVRNGEHLKVKTNGSRPKISTWNFEYPEAPTSAPATKPK